MDVHVSGETTDLSTHLSRHHKIITEKKNIKKPTPFKPLKKNPNNPKTRKKKTKKNNNNKKQTAKQYKDT